VKLWRVSRAAHAATKATAFSGIGGLHVDGRWHSRGRLVVYTARSESLARLEALVHFNPLLAPKLVLIEADIPDALVATLSGTLPKGWNDVPDSGLARSVGDTWLQGGSSVALEVPSIHALSEKNVLINPAHPDFSKLVISAPIPLAFDQRLNDRKLR
jgi:RES domain-containing protein